MQNFLFEQKHSRTPLQTKLKEATEALLNPEANRATILAATATLHTIFSSITGIRGDVSDPQYDTEIFVPNGLAISPCLAASCLSVEMVRTAKFLRGIQVAIQEALKRFPREPIHILYAGCGPYATLLMPFTTHFTPDQIQITLLDIHQASIERVTHLINELGVTDYFCDYVHGDAAIYQYPDTRPLHMIVTETMQMAFEKEPQVAITLNLLPQLAENGLLIPQNVFVEACLTDPKKEQYYLLVQKDEDNYPNIRSDFEKHRLNLGRIFEINIETGLRFIKNLNGQQSTLPPVTLNIPQYPPEKTQFMLLTTVNVFDDINVQGYESELSLPVILPDLSQVNPGTQLAFFYQFGRKPGFKYQTTPLRVNDLNKHSLKPSL